MIKVAIVGAGKAGCALLDLFQANGTVKTIGITDVNKSAPALSAARGWGIFIAEGLEELCGLGADLIMNVTGDPAVSSRIRQIAPGTEVVEGTGAKFLWEMVRRQETAKKDMKTLYANGLVLTSSKSLTDVLSATLEKAMALTETPAGSIALRTRGEMRMAVSRGLKESITDLASWKPRPNGLTSYLLKEKESLAVEDISVHPLFEDHRLLKEGIRALLACPLKINGDVVGILYLDDFRPREFSERHKNLIGLFGSQAAQAIEKFRTLDELYRVIGDLDETTAYLKNVLDDSGDMIVTTDAEGRIVEFSRGGERMLGYPRDEAVGRKAADFYADPGERRRLVAMLREDGMVRNYETRLVRKDGGTFDISLTLSTLRDKTGKVIGTVGVSKDITVEKRLRNELAKTNEELTDLNVRLEDKVIERTRELERINWELARANQVKARFISNMSHELRTPLNSILGFSEILLEETFGDLNERQKRHISNISASGKHLLQLVNNILDLAKIEAGKIELSYEDFRVGDAVEEVVMIMQSLSAKKSVRMAVEIDPAVSVFHADKVKFKQILYNLVSNAIKFTPEGGAAGIRVKIVSNRNSLVPWAVDGQDLLEVTVWDKGIGIREENLDRIFEEFEQVDPTFSKNFQGTGLGLALTRKLVELHGGQIGARSVHGQGSEFTFYLPAAVPEAGIPESEPFDPEMAVYPWVHEEAPLVLVVEDDLPTSEILTIHLNKAGYKVAHAYDGVEAIAKAKELKPFAVTLDVMLPKKDGWEVLQSLKAEAETRDIPVIIHSIVDNKDLAYALGASDYLMKPVDKTTLIGKLGELSLHMKKSASHVSLLLISDDRETQDYFAEMFEGNGVLYHTAPAEEEGLELAAATRPTMVLIDLGTCGLEIIKKLKANPSTSGIPIFAVTNKDLSVEERLALTGQIERIFRKNSLVPQDLIMHLKNVEIIHPRRAGLIDDLTGLFNHRYFHLRLAQEVNRSVRYKLPLTLILLDIDHFGHYVKEKGEYHGNLVLRKIAELLRRNIRGSDVVVRYGGDAFSVVLPNTLMAPAATLAKRFHAIIRDYPFLHEEVQPKGRITASVGVAAFRGQETEELIKCSELALARALQKGGNTVEVHE